MLGPESLSLLAALDRNQTEQRVRIIFDSRNRGNYESMLTTMSPSIVYEVVGPRNLFTHSGRREGIDSVRATLRELNINFETLDATLHDVMIEGERVVARRTATIRHRGTNAVGDVYIVHSMRFREGMLIELSEYPDTEMIGWLMGETEPAL